MFESEIKEIFVQLQGRYGADFTGRFSAGKSDKDGVDVGMKNAMKVWLEDLSPYLGNKAAIEKTLKSLTPKVPNLPEFLSALSQFCRAEITPLEQLPIDKNAAEKIAKITAEAFHEEPDTDYLRWAKRQILSPAAEKSLMDCVEMGDSRFFGIFLNRFDKGWMHGNRAEKIERMLRHRFREAA